MSTDVEPDPSSEPLELARLLRALAGAERELARALAAQLGLGATDLVALGHLVAEGPAGVNDLGRRVGLGSAAATGLADRLEAAGHVVREPHPTDRRRQVLVGTDAAREALLARLAPVGEDVARLAGRLDDRDRAVVGAFLRDVLAVYSQHARRGR